MMIAQQEQEWMLSDLLAGFATVEPKQDRVVVDLAIDSRDTIPGGAFVAISGSAKHGLAFADDATARGAQTILTDNRDTVPGGPIPVISVPGLAARLGELANRFFGSPSNALDVFAVTGTNGKSSVAFLLAAALRRMGRPCGYIGTLGSGSSDELERQRHTTPDIFGLTRRLRDFRHAGCVAATLEASSHALAQGRMDGTRLHAGAFTNLARDHLDFHADMQDYAAAKRRLFTDFNLAFSVINVDDTEGARIASLIANQEGISKLFTTSTTSDGSQQSGIPILARNIRTHRHGINFDLCIEGCSVPVTSRLLGQFNVENLLIVAGLLFAEGFETGHIAETLGQLDPVDGRMHRAGETAAGAQVVVDYAHSPDSLAAALQAVREMGPARVIVVFGCGGDRDRGKRAQMGAAASRDADIIVLTADNPRSESAAEIADHIATGISDNKLVEFIADRGAAIAYAIDTAESGDLVLVAGKGHETEQHINGDVRAFNDLEWLQQHLPVVYQ